MIEEEIEEREYKWEIEPHYSTDWDVYVTDSDSMAKYALLNVAEKLWDEMKSGEERIIKIRMR